MSIPYCAPRDVRKWYCETYVQHESGNIHLVLDTSDTEVVLTDISDKHGDFRSIPYEEFFREFSSYFLEGSTFDVWGYPVYCEVNPSRRKYRSMVLPSVAVYSLNKDLLPMRKKVAVHSILGGIGQEGRVSLLRILRPEVESVVLGNQYAIIKTKDSVDVLRDGKKVGIFCIESNTIELTSKLKALSGMAKLIKGELLDAGVQDDNLFE